jgi:hypothetical protein
MEEVNLWNYFPTENSISQLGYVGGARISVKVFSTIQQLWIGPIFFRYMLVATSRELLIVVQTIFKLSLLELARVAIIERVSQPRQALSLDIYIEMTLLESSEKVSTDSSSW